MCHTGKEYYLMDTLDGILKKFKITYHDSVESRNPIEIPNFGRDQLANLLAELGLNKGAEIGVEQGVYAEILLKANPKLLLYCIDAWKSHRGYRDHTNQDKLERFYAYTVDRLYNLNAKIVRAFSMDAIREFADESLDFVYIDANHDFPHVTEDIFHWSKKVRKGGIIAGHDYVKRKNEAAHVHVKQVLHGYTDAYNIKPWFVLGTDEKKEGEIRDETRTWMWVKV